MNLCDQDKSKDAKNIYSSSLTLKNVLMFELDTRMSSFVYHSFIKKLRDAWSLNKQISVKLCPLKLTSYLKGPYSLTILKNSLCLFLQNSVNLNVTELLIG